jgi:hypothetical protein
MDTAPASVVGDTAALYDRMTHLDDQVGRGGGGYVGNSPR